MKKAGFSNRSVDYIGSGSPCTNISRADPNHKNLLGKESGIFFECANVVKYVGEWNKALLAKKPYLLFENVKAELSVTERMGKTLTEKNGDEIVAIAVFNANLVSPISRLRVWQTTVPLTTSVLDFARLVGEEFRSGDYLTQLKLAAEPEQYPRIDEEMDTQWIFDPRRVPQIGGFMSSSKPQVTLPFVQQRRDGSIVDRSTSNVALSAIDQLVLMGYPSTHCDVLLNAPWNLNANVFEKKVRSLVGNAWSVPAAMYVLGALRPLYAAKKYDDLEPLVWVDPKAVGENIHARTSASAASDGRPL